MSKNEYKRLEWRLQKVYDLRRDEWGYRVAYKFNVFLWWTSWCEIRKDNLVTCHYIRSDSYSTYGYDEIVTFKSEELAREFIEFYEDYRKRMFLVYKELENPYIEVK